MSDELKPCPFCGDIDSLSQRCDESVSCGMCGAEGPIGMERFGECFGWNDRAIDPAAIRKAALQEAADVVRKSADVVRKFSEAMTAICAHSDADNLRCDAASVALIGASSAILALIEKDASDD